jgi:undecaprenyl-diphosphatase
LSIEGIRSLEHLIEVIILGIIQGIAEWLPISSTGHLRIAERLLLGHPIPLLFDITLHIGTLIVIFVFFRNDIKSILTALAHRDFKSEYGRLIPLIVVGTIPTGLIGLIFSDVVESAFSDILPIAIALIIAGCLLFASRFAREKTDTVTYKTALIFGVAQGIAIIPGLSRSGTTIAVALLLGLKREKAFRFSFLLSIPAIIGALSLLAYKERSQLTASGFGSTEMLLGIAIAMIVGYLALKLLQKVVLDRKFYLFAIYCWLAGSVLIALSLSGF